MSELTSTRSEDSRAAADVSPLLDRRSLSLLLSASALLLASVSSPIWALVAAVTGVSLGSAALLAKKGGTIKATAFVRFAGLTGLVVFALSATTQRILTPEFAVGDFLLWMGGPALVAAVALMRPRLFLRRATRGFVAAILLLSVAFSGFAVAHRYHGERVGLDVYLSHIAAADTIAEGENPYTSAVRVPDGSPGAPEGAVIEGYSYPPVALIGYAASEVLIGDPRWLNVVCGVLLVFLLAWRSRSEDGLVGFAFLLLAAVGPIWRMIVFSGWTEPLSVTLIILGVVLWRRWPVSAVVLGLGLASKQYLIVLLPLLLLVPDAKKIRRVATASAVAVATLIPFAVWDFHALVRTLVTRPAGLVTRPDTQSLMGAIGATNNAIFGIAGVLVAILVSWKLASRVNGQSDVLVAAGLVLATMFGISQAYPNYWYAVSMLTLIGGGLRSSGRRSPLAGRHQNRRSHGP